MKVLAAPFEPPLVKTELEAGDKARLETEAQSADGVQPIQASGADLGPATRQSLSKLAVLIRSQQLAEDESDQHSKEEAEERIEAERLATPKLSLAGEPIPSPDEVLGGETVFKSTFPNVDRARHMLKAAARRRGIGLYGKAS